MSNITIVPPIAYQFTALDNRPVTINRTQLAAMLTGLYWTVEADDQRQMIEVIARMFDCKKERVEDA